MELTDRQTTADGYLAVHAKIARMGIYQYARSEIGDTEGNPNELVSVYRPEDAVFDPEAMASFAHKPITLNHPVEDVRSDNWKKYSRGMAGGRVVRTGDFLEIPMVVNDSEAIAAIEAGKRELSAGYSATITVGDGMTPEGEPYRAIMSDIRGNHIAIVDRGRAGSQCRIGDAAWPIEDTQTPPKPRKEITNMATFMLDGLKVDLSDTEATTAALTKLRDAATAADKRAADSAKDLTDAEAKHASELKDANDAKAKAEADAVSANKALEDSKVTPEQLRDAAKAYANIVDAATKIAPDFKVEDSMTEADIRKGVVLAKFGDSYADKSDTFFDALFEVESAKVKDAKVETIDPYRATMAARDSTALTDARTTAVTARQEMIDRMINPVAADAK